MQAEAVADLIDAVTPLQARAAFDQLEGTLTRAIAEIDAALFDLIARLEASVDFPDEGYHFVEPGALAAAIDDLRARTARAAGRRAARPPRSRRTAGRDRRQARTSASRACSTRSSAPSRAIVTDVPGTTRDLVTEVVDLDGLRVTLVDTAGLARQRPTSSRPKAWRDRGRRSRVADLVLAVIDDDDSRSN